MNVFSLLYTHLEHATCSITEGVKNYRNLTFGITLQCFLLKKHNKTKQHNKNKQKNKRKKRTHHKTKQTVCFQGIPASCGWYWCGSSRMSSLSLVVKYVFKAKGQLLQPEDHIFFFEPWVWSGCEMAALSSGNGCVLDSPTLWAFVLRQLQMDPCWAFEGWALAQMRRLKGSFFFFISKWKCKEIFFWGTECN